MKKIQDYRFLVQLLCLILTAVSFSISFKFTSLLILTLTFFTGVFYCGWVCPFGFIQDSFGYIGSAFGIKKRKIPKFLHRILKFSRYLILMLLLLNWSDFIFTALQFDPRVNFLSLVSGNTVIIISILVLVFFSLVSIFFQRPFCNYLCVQGAKYGLLSLFRVFTIKRDADKCVNCKKCEQVCPMHIDITNTGNLRDPNCINCFQCISSCPVEKTLSFGRVKLSRPKKIHFSKVIVLLTLALSLFIYYSSSISHASGNNGQAIPAEKVEGIADADIAIGLKDGSYEGSSKGYKGTVKVEVTVKNEIIQNIDIISHEDDAVWFNRAKNTVLGEIIKSQNTDVDTVAGATYSSAGIINAVLNAVKTGSQ